MTVDRLLNFDNTDGFGQDPEVNLLIRQITPQISGRHDTYERKQGNVNPEVFKIQFVMSTR